MPLRLVHPAPPPPPDPPPPPPPAAPAVPPRARQAPPPRFRHRRPNHWAKFRVESPADPLCHFLRYAEIHYIPVMGKQQVRDAWEQLSSRAKQKDREPLLLYKTSAHGKLRARFRRVYGYRLVRFKDDDFSYAASVGYTIDAACHRLRAAGSDRRHLARLAAVASGSS